MWLAKIKIPMLKGALMSSLAYKNKVTIAAYPIAHQVMADHILVTGAGLILGPPENIRAFCRNAKKEKRMVHFEIKNNFMVCLAKQHLANKYLLSPHIFQVKPVVVNTNGEYIFALASWEKKDLITVIKVYTSPPFNGQLLWKKQKKLTTIQTMTVNPNLTEKQKHCLHLAIEQRYYDYPRKITLKELAKIAGLSYSTYQFHLQNAEKKIMPFLESVVE
ncbi:helix-turn-helix domain-containing protein [Candidatus Woesearchaeota archaeon]|nr:helix-turn-helix domain-containing protein [Candidatus Woesearchaeota archaeon]